MAKMKITQRESRILRAEKDIKNINDALNKTLNITKEEFEKVGNDFQKVETQFKVLEDRIIEYKKDIHHALQYELKFFAEKQRYLEKEMARVHTQAIIKIQSSWILRKLFGMKKDTNANKTK